MLLFPQVILEPSTVVSSLSLTGGSEKSYKQDGELIMYFEVASYLPDTNAADAFISEAEAEAANFKQPTKITASGYSEIPLERAVQSGLVYNKQTRIKRFIKGLHPSMRHEMRIYREAQKDDTPHNFRRHVIPLVKIRESTSSPSSSSQKRGKADKSSSCFPETQQNSYR